MNCSWLSINNSPSESHDFSKGCVPPMEQLFYFGQRSPAKTLRATPVSEIFAELNAAAFPFSLFSY
jgi:hypothetical protein